jgi:UDP-N-acetylmuramate dehydrogenase
MSETEDWRAEIRRRTTAEIRLDEEASRHTSIGVGGRIDAIVFPRSEEELVRIVRFLKEARIPFLPVGNWTNLIVTDCGYRGALVSLSGLTALDFGEGPAGDVRLTAQAGVSLAELVNLSIREALTGIEFCAGIPGSLGGALRMNAGAYGGRDQGHRRDGASAGPLRRDPGGIPERSAIHIQKP